MTRRQDWEQRLNDYLAAHARAEFEWGRADCALFVAGAVDAQTGEDPAARFRGKYRSEKAAQSAIRRAGSRNLAELVDKLLPRKPKAMAQRGDVVMVKGGHLAIVFGEVALGLGEEPLTGRTGLIRVPRADWRKAWAVG